MSSQSFRTELFGQDCYVAWDGIGDAVIYLGEKAPVIIATLPEPVNMRLINAALLLAGRGYKRGVKEGRHGFAADLRKLIEEGINDVPT